MIQTQPNERRTGTATRITHTVPIPPCCTVSQNPRPGSTFAVSYTAGDVFLEVASLYATVWSYRGGKGDVRSMEGMVQALAQECANAVGVRVEVVAELVLVPDQRMTVATSAIPGRTIPSFAPIPDVAPDALPESPCGESTPPAGESTAPAGATAPPSADAAQVGCPFRG